MVTIREHIPIPDESGTGVVVDADHAWAVGNHSYVAAITDGGATWNSQPSGTEVMLSQSEPL